MATKIPDSSNLVDQQFLQVNGPDGIVTGYQYNAETQSLYQRESQVVIPAFHGQTHIAEDPVPNATTDLPGLMSADDKAKLDTITQTRVGVLGFQGSGFPDDGGWLQGDIILAAGTEFISLERIGNVVRFTVDSPIPLNCGCEECAQIFWIQDETDTSSIRPPTCAGKLPGVNAYGEFKAYLMPESLVVNPSSPEEALNTKINFPTLAFKRHDDSITPGTGEFELVLERNTNGTTKVGWAMTPGALQVPECVWFMGHDDDQNTIRFELSPNTEPGLLGSLLYKGHTLTRQMATIVDYTANILSTNQYVCRFWDIDGAEPLESQFTATNIWRYDNPENLPTDLTNPRKLVFDATSDVLEIGTLVQIWEFEIGELNGDRLVRRYFNKEPNLNPATLWSHGDIVSFGNLLVARDEVQIGGETDITELTASEDNIEDIRLFENRMWGLTGFEDPLLVADDEASTNTVSFNGSITAIGIENPNIPSPNVEFTISQSFTENLLQGETAQFLNVAGLEDREFTVIQNTGTSVTLVHLGPDELTALTTAAGGLPQQLMIYSETTSGSPSGIPINNRFVANIDYDRPALLVEQLDPDEDRERPIFLWHRGSHKNVLVTAKIGMPENSKFPPIDLLMRAPGDSFDDTYMQVVQRGTYTSGAYTGADWIRVTGVQHRDLPQNGTLRTLSGTWRDRIWKYNRKIPYGGLANGSSIILVGNAGDPFLFDEDFVPAEGGNDPSAFPIVIYPGNTTVAELTHQDYSAPCLRVEFSVNDNTDSESVQAQFKGGILDMNEPYELDANLPEDNFVRGMRPGSFAVSQVLTQDGFIDTGVENPESDPSGFKVYTGGALAAEIDGQSELWNELKVMLRGGQMWVWWNGVIIPPDGTASAALPTPVAVNTPYFPIDWDFDVGKVVMRLWPGAVVRELEVRSQLEQFNEFKYGQLELSTSGGSGT